MPHKTVYSQPVEQNICITRIYSLARINLAQIYYEYFGPSSQYYIHYCILVYHQVVPGLLVGQVVCLVRILVRMKECRGAV